MTIVQGGVTAPCGFGASGIYAGIKKKEKLDLAVLVSDLPAVVAGAFTTNVVKAAPVVVDMEIVQSGKPVRAVVVNSGNANACTGDQGLADAKRMCACVAGDLGCLDSEVLVCSTGVIGLPMPMAVVEQGIHKALQSVGHTLESGSDAAKAICTTDTFSKECAVEIIADGVPIRIGGMAKGSGMIHPNMATMLSFITTDAAVDQQYLRTLLGTTVRDSYNMISVDGDTSTNDTVLVLANGASGSPLIDKDSPWAEAFADAFLHVHAQLAKLIVRDGEGAGKFIEVQVTGASDSGNARKLAKAVVSSNLVKAAFFGSDANWGRILCAMGYSGADFDPTGVSIRYRSAAGEILVVQKGVPVSFDESVAKQILLEKDVGVLADLSDGEAQAVAWGCDLSYEYVRINGDYRS